VTRASNPQFSFADLEFLSQGVRLEPVLQALSQFIDKHAQLVERVRRDLVRGLSRPDTGRNGLTAQEVLRSLTLMRVKNWDYRELRERIADGYTLRHFTHFNSKPVPKHDAFNRAFNRLTPATLEAINQSVVRAAVALGFEDGKKLRVDTTVVETDIHHPTDSTLLWDAVRVITRLVRRLGEFVPIQGFSNHTRCARRRMQELQRMTARQRHTQQRPKYRELIQGTRRVIQSARGVLEQTKGPSGIDFMTKMLVNGLRQELQHYCELGERVLDQARRRVLEGEQVPNEEKIYSLFEPHTDLIKRGKVLKPVEFGHKVFLAESGCGLITQYRVLDGNPPDQVHVRQSVERHKQLFGRIPEIYSSDRGFFSEENIKYCQEAGVSLACIPYAGARRSPEQTAHEKSPAFKKAQRFRAGIEGRISALFRGRGMKRCLAQGRERFELLVGAAVLTNNLMIIAQLIAKKQSHQRLAA
jgi:transposase, IS5 family